MSMYLDELTTTDSVYHFPNGATARYFQTVFEDDVSYDSVIAIGVSDEEKDRLVRLIDGWFGPIPDGYVRLYHGADSDTAEAIINGIDQNGINGFIRGFDPEDDIDDAFDAGVTGGQSCSCPGSRGSIIAFDVKEEDYDRLEEFEFRAERVNLDGWRSIVRVCMTIARNYLPFVDSAVAAGPVSSLLEGFDDQKPPSSAEQQCFLLEDNGLVFLKGPEKVSIAVYEVEKDIDDHSML